MKSETYTRKMKEDKPVVAICYDFDKTLSPMNMQEGFIKSVGKEVDLFWKNSNGFAKSNDMDQNLAYMYMMIRESEGKLVFTKKMLEAYGSEVTLYPGVEEWFNRITEYGKEKGIIVEHYIISSGLREMIEGTKPAKNGAFEKIFASSFYYDENNVARWPAQVINYTSKTQFLFRIEKGTLDINDPGVNEFFPLDKRRVPFRNMVYIGDSDTDIPCMRLVNTYGGYSIGVYNSESNDKSKVYQMMRDGRIKYFVEADYSKGTELDLLIKNIIDRTAANELLEEAHYRCTAELKRVDVRMDEEQKRKVQLINRLEESNSFISTFTIIEEMEKISDWTDEEIQRLCAVAHNNIQVTLVLRESPVSNFFNRLTEHEKGGGKYVDWVKYALKKDDYKLKGN